MPPLTQHAVPRPRLVNALECGVPEHKLILISAPAGYGKTTLLAQWAHTSRHPVVWYSIDAEDNDLHRFLRYLVTAWEQVQPDVRDCPAGLLLDSMTPDSDAVLTAFLNEASDLTDHLVLVVDDYHLITEPSIHNAVAFLLDHLPPELHVVLAGRGEPPLTLARYRARQELLELDTVDLAFLPDETDALLNGHMGLQLGPAELRLLQSRLEGWITGLRLAAISRQHSSSRLDTLAVSGRQRFIADYLREDVLAYLPENVQRFLLQTSMLNRLCGSLCNAVTDRVDSQSMLEGLERGGLFLIPLDDRREWFRYHQLFADFLHEELQRRHPDDVAELHRRAGQWYMDHDLPEQAFDHAIAGNDLNLTIQIGERYLYVKLHNGEFNVLRHWLSTIPPEWHAAYPTFRLAEAGLLAYSGAVDACVHCVDEVEQMLGPSETYDLQSQLARVTALRCFVACFQNDLDRAETFADQALENLAQEDVTFRADTYHALGDTYRRNGRWEEARACYLKVLDFTSAPTFRSLSVHVYGALADLEQRQGHLRTSTAYWGQALSAIEDRKNRGLFPQSVVGWVYLRMGETLYEWNELADARQHLTRGLAHAELGGDTRAMIAGYLVAGRIELTEGDVDSAAVFLERARPLVEQTSFPDWTSRFERLQLELWLAQDRLRAAVLWSDEMLRNDALQQRPESEAAWLAMARVLILKGDIPAIERALSLLAHLLRSAETEGRTGIAIEVLTMQSLALWTRGDRPAAMTSLERALRLAEPERYVRLFVDLGLPMARLLQEARARKIMPGYVASLLAAYGESTLNLAPAMTLPEPLTRREQEIIQLIAAGLTNQEIGKQLSISPQTVKKHSGNIYGKLSVRTRTEAASRARQLDLLD